MGQIDKSEDLRGKYELLGRKEKKARLDNTSHIIKRTSKMIKMDRNIVFSGLKFYTEGAKI